MERKSISFEMKDLDKGSRIAVIAHAHYNNIDRTKDISRKGMFTKSWNESKDDINFYFNHNDEQAPGKIVDVFEDNEKAYTKAWLGTHTLGNDTLIMMDEGVIKKASFGYQAMQSKFIEVKGQKIRELTEVKHFETSVLTKMPANPLAGIVKVQKSFTPVELKEFRDRLEVLEKFVRNTKASDECILSICQQIVEIKELISEYDTDLTLVQEPESSKNDELLTVKNYTNNLIVKKHGQRIKDGPRRIEV